MTTLMHDNKIDYTRENWYVLLQLIIRLNKLDNVEGGQFRVIILWAELLALLRAIGKKNK